MFASIFNIPEKALNPVWRQASIEQRSAQVTSKQVKQLFNFTTVVCCIIIIALLSGLRLLGLINFYRFLLCLGTTQWPVAIPYPNIRRLNTIKKLSYGRATAENVGKNLPFAAVIKPPKAGGI